MDAQSQIQRLNSSLINIISLYQDIIKEMDNVMTIIYNELGRPEGDELIRHTIHNSQVIVKRKLLEIDLILASIREEFGIDNPILH